MSIQQIRQLATAHLFQHLSEAIETEQGEVRAMIHPQDNPNLSFKGQKLSLSQHWQAIIISVQEDDAHKIQGTLTIAGKEWEPVERTRHHTHPDIIQIELAPKQMTPPDTTQWR